MEDADCTEMMPSEEQKENSDLEDGEIEDDDDEEPTPAEAEKLPDTEIKESQQQQQLLLPTPVPTDTNIFTPLNSSEAPPSTTSHKEKKRDRSERKSEKHHLTEAEKCVRMLHKMERAERERRERLRREQLSTDDFAGNVERAIASVLKKDRHSGVSAEEEEDEEKKRGRKRKKKDRERKKKHRKLESPKADEVDEDEMLNIRGGSPENKLQKENSPVNDVDGTAYESYDSEYESDNFHSSRQSKRNFDRDRKNRNRIRRQRKTFTEKNRNKKENEQQQQQDADSLCLFYMQGKCHKGDECPYSHNALPPMKMELCKFYLMDCCAKRDKCLYMHHEFPCKFYHTGLKCFGKDNCKFAHGEPLNDTLRQILLKHLETAPKEILGEFPRLSRDGAAQMITQTQKSLEVKYGVKAPLLNGPPAEKTGIPSLFDITVPVPPELMQQQLLQLQQQQQQQQNATTGSDENKTKSAEKTDKPTKVRHTRWNDEPAVPIMSLLNPAFAGNVGNAYSSLTLQDQQKINEYQLNFQLKGFYSEQDQDMRINSNGDVDMRALPKILPPTETIATAAAAAATTINFEQYKLDAGLTSNLPPVKSEQTEAKPMDTDIRPMLPAPIEPAHVPDNLIIDVKKEEVTSDAEPSLMIDEKAGDSGSEIPNLPKKQRELFLRIQAQQKENIPENQESADGNLTMKEDDWYSSDDDNDPLSKMVIHLEDEPKEDEEDEDIKSPTATSPAVIPPAVPGVDLSKIDISAEVSKLLSSLKGGQNLMPTTPPMPAPVPSSIPDISPTLSMTAPASDVPKSRDPRQAKNFDSEIKSPKYNSDPRSKSQSTQSTRVSIYEQGIINTESPQAELPKADVDLRTLEATKDLDMRPSYGDTDLRTARKDVDLRQLGLSFKAMENYTPATEIEGMTLNPMNYKLSIIDIPRPDYTGLRFSPQDAPVKVDPRLRKIFRLDEVELKEKEVVKDSPASPKQTRADPRRKAKDIDNTTSTLLSAGDANNLSYSQQISLLQNSVFYQSLTSNQKLMLNREISSKGEAANDPILQGILSNLGLVKSMADQQNGSATNILNNVNSLVPPVLCQNMPMGGNMVPPGVTNMPAMGPGGMMMPPNMGNPVLGPMGGGNVGPGLLGAAPPGIDPSLGQNFQVNFNPRNGGLLGTAPPFQNFQETNFQYQNDYNNEDGNFNNTNNNQNYNTRNDRNFRDRNPRRGRSWNNRHNNARNYNNNRNSNRNRSNRSYTPP